MLSLLRKEILTKRVTYIMIHAKFSLNESATNEFMLVKTGTYAFWKKNGNRIPETVFPFMLCVLKLKCGRNFGLKSIWDLIEVF